MKKVFLMIVVLAAALEGQTRVLTIEESLRIGLENSKGLKISQAKVAASDAKITETTSQLLPKLSVNAGYTRLSDLPPSIINLGIPGIPSLNIFPVILDNYALRATIQQPLFTGWRLTSLRSASKINNEAATADYSADANEAAFTIHTVFWNYYRMEQTLKFVEENLKQLEKHVLDTKNFLDNGIATKNDYLKLEVQYSNAKLKMIQAENDLDVARATFNMALGLPLTEKTDIAAAEIAAGEKEDAYNDLLREAFAQRGQLKAAQLRVDAGEATVTAAQGGWFPSIYLNGNYYYNRPNARVIPAVDAFQYTWDVGVALSWDIWNWGYTSSQTSQAEQQLVQTKTTFDQLKDNVELEVYQAYLDMRSARDAVDVNKKTVEQAEENARITNEQYNQQAATSTDLIDAETSLLNAKTQLTNALVAFQLAKVKLDKAAGRKIY